jgi:glyoxylase-like metal-dependent hydrolase (beta-lactamase superfamily II)
MAAGSPIDFTAGAPVAGDLDVRWIHGSPPARRGTDPKIQVHGFDQHTFVMRQNKDTSFEAPFLYLFCGNNRALLLDTGATADSAAFPLRETVDGVLASWLADHPRPRYELVVAHTHGHNDHVAGDVQFGGRPATTVVARDVEAVQSFFGFSAWPDQVVPFDMGGRVLEVTGIPGHHPASIAVYDPWSGFLVTGDTVLPGRLYVRDFPAFTASLDRLVSLGDSRAVSHVMGCHIEMTRIPRRDYPLGCRYQPDEPPLQMSIGQLAAVRDAAATVADEPGVHAYDDFIIYNGSSARTTATLMARGAWDRVRYRLAALRRQAPATS